MPRLWDRSKRERRTPFSDLLADYLEAHKWMRPKHLASDTGLSATTIQRYLNGEVVPHDPRILQQISAGTGIPLNQLYEAAGLWLPPPLPVEAQQQLPPPPMPHVAQRRRPPRIAEQQSPYAALEEYSRSIQAFQLPDEVKRAMIDTMLAAMRPAPVVPVVPVVPAAPPPWDDHDAISTLQLPTIPPARTPTADEPQEESQPAGTCS